MKINLKEGFIEETNAVEKIHTKNDELIQQESKSYYFYYLLEGEVCVYNIADEGKIFMHHKVFENNFFGEPAVILDIPFPGYVSVTSETARVLKIPREKLIEYLKKHPDWSFEFLGSVAEKSMRKSKLLRSVIFLNPEERILMHFKEFKRGATEKMQIDLTRKELSTMTGLRVETVIRAIKKMEKEGKLEIIKGKVYY